MRGASAAGVAMLVALSAGGADAQVATEPIRIDFKAHPGCPDEAQFTGEVRARTRKARLAFPAEPARFFRVLVTRERGGGGKSRGKLTIEDPSGTLSTRDVTGGSCAEVVSALALITALAIDPKASTSLELPTTPPPPTVTDVPQLHPPTEPILPPIWPHHEFEPPAEWPWPPIAVPLPALLPPPPPPRPAHWVGRVGAQAVGRGAMGPGLAPGIGLFVDRELDADRSAPPSLGWRPAFRGWLTIAQHAEISTDVDRGGGALVTGTSTFRLLDVALEACPAAFDAGPVALRPCVSLGAGTVTSVGSIAGTSTTHLRPWVSAEGTARIEWTPLDYLFIEAEVSAVVPFVRDTYQFEPPPGTEPAVIYDVPSLGGGLGAGAGVRFP